MGSGSSAQNASGQQGSAGAFPDQNVPLPWQQVPPPQQKSSQQQQLPTQAIKQQEEEFQQIVASSSPFTIRPIGPTIVPPPVYQQAPVDISWVVGGAGAAAATAVNSALGASGDGSVTISLSDIATLALRAHDISAVEITGYSGEDDSAGTAVWQGSMAVSVWKYSLKMHSAEQAEKFKATVASLFSLAHPHLNPAFGMSSSPDSLLLLFDNMSEDTLYSCLHENGVGFSVKAKVGLAQDVISALRHMHSKDLTHGSLNSKNILVVKVGQGEGSYRAKLTDYMFNDYAISDSALTSKSFQPAYIAPEVLRAPPKAPKTRPSDIWSFGVVFWEIVTHKIPFADKSFSQIIGEVGFSNVKLEIPKTFVGSNTATILSGCFDEQAKRATAPLVASKLAIEYKSVA